MALSGFALAAILLLLGSKTDASVRLSSKVPGTNPWEGVLEMLVDGVWNTVCNQWFTVNLVPPTLACHDLGYPGFDSYVGNYTAYYGSFSDKSSAVDFIYCSGSENSIQECGITTGTCPPASYVAMKCQPPPSNDSTQVSLPLISYSSLMTITPSTVLYLSTSVVKCGDMDCSTHSNINDFTTILHMHIMSSSIPSSTAMPIMPIPSSPTTPDIRLSSKVPGTNPWEGVLEMLVDGVWNTVCNQWFTVSLVPPTLACHDLGYPGFDSYVGNYTVYYGSFSDKSSAVDFIYCSGLENSIQECGITTGTCPPASYVAMKCQPPLSSVPTLSYSSTDSLTLTSTSSMIEYSTPMQSTSFLSVTSKLSTTSSTMGTITPLIQSTAMSQPTSRAAAVPLPGPTTTVSRESHFTPPPLTPSMSLEDDVATHYASATMHPTETGSSGDVPVCFISYITGACSIAFTFMVYNLHRL